MQQAKTKKSISVPEMGRMLGVGTVESYWLVKKNYFTKTNNSKSIQYIFYI